MFSIHSEMSSLRRDSWSFNLFRAQGKYQIVIVIPFEIKHSQFFFAIFVIFYFFFASLTPFSLGKSESPCRPSECELQLFFSTEKGLKFQCCRQEIQFFYIPLPLLACSDLVVFFFSLLHYPIIGSFGLQRNLWRLVQKGYPIANLQILNPLKEFIFLLSIQNYVSQL